jgi:hypothetical protein
MRQKHASPLKTRDSGTGKPTHRFGELARRALAILDGPDWDLLDLDDPDEIARVRGELARIATDGATNAFDISVGRVLAFADWHARAEAVAARLLRRFEKHTLGRKPRPAMSADLAQQLAGLATSAWGIELMGTGAQLTSAHARARLLAVLRGEPLPLEAYFPLPQGGSVATVLLAARSLRNAIADVAPDVADSAEQHLQELLASVANGLLVRAGDEGVGRVFTKAVFELVAAAHPDWPQTRVSSFAAEVTEELNFERELRPETLRKRMRRAKATTPR